MATITSTTSGLWTAGATWVGGVAPADNDTVVIATGHNVTLDVDMTAWANGITGNPALTVTGTLTGSVVASNYLKIKATGANGGIAGAGSFLVGTAATPLPIAVKHTVDFTSQAYVGYNMSVGLTVKVFSTEPVVKYVQTTQADNSGQKVLHYNTSLAVDIAAGLWAVGDTLVICNVNGGRDVQPIADSVIAAIDNTARTITLNSNLDSNQVTGAVIALQQRNCRIINLGAVTAAYAFSTALGGNLVSGYDIRGNGNTPGSLMNACPGAIINGALTIAGSGGIVANCLGALVNAPITNGAFAALVYSHNSRMTSIAAGCGQGPSFSINICVTGSLAGNNTGISSCSGNVTNAKIEGNGVGIIYSDMELYSCILGGTIPNNTDVAYNAVNQGLSLVKSRNHANVAGDTRFWSAGGYGATDLTVVAPGYDRSRKLTFQNVSGLTLYNHWEEKYVGQPGQQFCVVGAIQKSANSMTYAPRVQIIDPQNDPLIDATKSPLAEFVCAEDTGTWHEFSLSYMPTQVTALIVRFIGCNGSETSNAMWSLSPAVVRV